MPNPITRTLDRWSRAREERREAARLAAMPERLLRDMGLSLEGLAAIAAQIRG
jgi:uncharacterized protein YjiS (DUF1127 family)